MGFDSWRFGTRMLVGFGSILALILVVAALAIYNQKQISGVMDELMERDTARMSLVYEIMLNNLESANSLALILFEKNDDVVKKYVADRKVTTAASTERFRKLEELTLLPEGKALLADLDKVRKPYTEARVKTLELLESGKRDEAVTLWSTRGPVVLKNYRAGLQKNLDWLKKRTDERRAIIAHSNATTIMIILVATGAAVLLGAVVALLITRGLLRQLGGEPQYAADVARRIADGDLTVEVKTRGNDSSSMLYAMRSMAEKLTGTISGIHRASSSISSASQEIAAGNADLSQRTEEQASSLEETASSMEELTSTVKQSADNARQANQLASGASAIAVKGGDVVGQVVSTMSGISESSKKIADIIGVIDGIAFQTNILALNAAVEAARAGEQGRGFAVVASEVRTLAQRSAAAAKEIKELITDSVSKVEGGTQLVNEAGKTMEEIVTAVKRVTDIMAEITAAAQEQSSGIEQVNQAVMQMDQTTQQNAALVEQAAAAADSMQQQAQVLSKAVSVFKVAHAAQAPVAQALEPIRAEPQERRGPNRAKNVTRMSQKRVSKAETEAELSKTGTHDEWSEF